MPRSEVKASGPLLEDIRRDAEKLSDSEVVKGDLMFLLSEVDALSAALKEACDGWEEASQYKGEFLAWKHGDADDIARLRKLLGGE